MRDCVYTLHSIEYIVYLGWIAAYTLYSIVEYI